MSQVEGDSLRVRRAVAEDWSVMRTIRLEALVDTPEAFGTRFADARAFPESRWREMIVGRCNFLAERAGAVVGTITTAGNDDHPGTHWMYGMYVTPSARGTGAAEALVGAVVERVRSEGADALYLHVTSSVDRAIAFYRRLGFQETGEQFAMPRKPELTLLTLRKNLD